MKKLLGFVLLSASVSGCISVDTYREGAVDPQAGLSDNSANPYKINYTLGQQRVKGTGKSECWCWFFSSNDGKHMNYPGFCMDAGISSAKESATFDAVDSAKADALMGAMYRYTKTSKWLGFYKSVECEVVGFPAFVSGIEKIEDRPVIINKEEQVIRLKPWEKVETSKDSKGLFPKFF